MAWELKRLAQFVAPLVEASFYTVPVDTTAIVKQAVVANTSSAPAALFLSAVPAGGVAGNQNRLVGGTTIPAGASIALDLTTVLAAGDFLSARSSVAGALTVTVSGLENPGSNGSSSGTVVGSPPVFGSPVAVGTANADGVSSELVRADHVHRAITTVAPLDGATAAALGAELFAARGDHRHRTVAASGTPADVDLTAAALGAAELAARSDHRHKLGDSGWIALPLVNSWVSYDNTYGPPRYRKVAGVVFVQGLIRSGSLGAVAFTLPAGYRPSLKLLFVVDRDPNVDGRIDVETNGNVVMVTASTGWTSLSGITFPADQ